MGYDWRISTPSRRVSAGFLFACTALLAAGCADHDPVDVREVPGTPQPVIATGAFVGTSLVTITVESGRRSPVADVVVTLVHPTAGPIRQGKTNSSGVVSFNNLASGIRLFAHGRPNVTLDAGGYSIFPSDPETQPVGNLVAKILAPALTGPRGSSLPVNLGNYLAAMANPPILTNSTRSGVSLSLLLSSGVSVNVQPLGLDGGAPKGLNVGAVQPFVSLTADYQARENACTQFPWLSTGAAFQQCVDGTGPGFLMSADESGSAALMAVEATEGFVIEVLDRVSERQQGLLSATEPIASPQSGTIELALDALLCKVNTEPELPGDGGVVDIQPDITYGIQMDYTEAGISPRPDQVAYFWTQSQTAPAQITLSTRTQWSGTPSPLTFFFTFNTPDCSLVSLSGTGVTPPTLMTGAAFCRPLGNGLTEVTVLQGNLPIGSQLWTSHEFNIKTSGEAVPDASRGNTSRAFVSVDRPPHCDVPTSNDGRFSISL